MLQCLLVGFTLDIVLLVIFFDFALENTFLGPHFANIR